MPPLHPPTVVLPPIAKIINCSPEELSERLLYLRRLYSPNVRGSKILSRRRCYPTQDDAPSSENLVYKPATIDPENQALDELRSDSFERTYAIRWLTAFCARADRLADATDGVASAVVSLDSLVQDAAALLAICAGTASAGTISRNFAFDQGKVQVQLTDIPLDNHDYSSVGAQTWGGACVLSEMIVQSPQDFGITASALRGPFRVLEVGAGTGLVSLVVGKLVQARCNADARNCSVVATDYHPSILANLEHNILRNFPGTGSSDYVSVSAHFLDWAQYYRQDSEGASPPFNTPFDVILGADIVYESEHALWIKGCVKKLLRKPADADGGHPPQFHLVIPLRSTHAAESGTIERVFSRADTESSVENTERTWDLRILSKESIVCEAGGDVRYRGNGAEVGYAYYRIGWLKV